MHRPWLEVSPPHPRPHFSVTSTAVVGQPHEQESRPRVRSEPRAAHGRPHAFAEQTNAAIDVEDLITRSVAALDDGLGYPPRR